MRIGILTYHDEVNYGSLLQAYAMQSALTQLGYEAVIIDRWFQPDQARLYGIWHQRSLREIIKFILGIVSFNGMFSKYVRMFRSRKFIHEYLRLTPYHFCDWKDAPKELGLDLVTVGSDQVWHPGSQPDVYLLNYLKNVPGIAYAASFGATDIPEEKRALYRAGFKNFKAIGVRELEGVKIVESLSGMAQHVVDPTLLADPSAYAPFLSKSRGKHITCYFLSEGFADYIVRIGKFAKHRGLSVDFFAQDFEMWSIPAIIKCKWAQLVYPIKVRYASGPADFVSSISTADCVFTNSFHALMFSLVYRRNVRVVEPTAPWRKGMSARMREFSGSMIKGPLIMKNLDDAIASYDSDERVSYDDCQIGQRIADSRAWLTGVISAVKTDWNA